MSSLSKLITLFFKTCLKEENVGLFFSLSVRKLFHNLGPRKTIENFDVFDDLGSWKLFKEKRVL